MVINNAGVIERGGIDDVTAYSMLHCFQVNTLGPIFVTQALLRHKLLKPGSLVANVTSLVRPLFKTYWISSLQGKPGSLAEHHFLGRNDGACHRWLRLVTVHVEPPKYLCPNAAPHSPPIDGPLTLGFGVQVASIAENEGGGMYAYRCSKTAANMATKSMSIDLAERGITCTILHPGYVRTDMTNGNGVINKDESVQGMLKVLESGVPLNGEWYHTSGRHLPW